MLQLSTIKVVTEVDGTNRATLYKLGSEEAAEMNFTYSKIMVVRPVEALLYTVVPKNNEACTVI